MSRFMWGTVTAVSPLRVRLDGDPAALPLVPGSIAGPLHVGDRVRVEMTDSRRVVILGQSGGQGAAGVVEAFAGASAPVGYLLCNGQAVSRTTYARLFAAIGTLHGAGDGTTSFNVPDYRGRSLFGLDPAQTEFDQVGKGGGAKTHTHAAGGLFAALYAGYLKFRSSGVGWTATNSNNFTIPGADSNSNAGGPAVEGDTAAGSTLPPFRTVQFIIRT